MPLKISYLLGPLYHLKKIPLTHILLLLLCLWHYIFHFYWLFFDSHLEKKLLAAAMALNKKSRAINILSRKPNLMLEIRQCDIDH